MWPFSKRKHTQQSSPRQYATVAQAAHAGDLCAVRQMLKRGDDPNSYDPKYAAYAIQLALSAQSVESGSHADIVQLLLDHGANVNVGTKTPLWVADILRRAGAQLHADGANRLIAPAKEQEIRKVVRELMYFADQMQVPRSEWADMIERKINIQPGPGTADSQYLAFKQEVRKLIEEMIAER